MMRMRSSDHLQFVVTALASFCIFSLGSRAYAGSSGEPDIPSVTRGPEPRTVDEELKLATDYFIGRGMAQDLRLAAHWYEKAAEAGDPEAQMQTGYLYDNGIGVARDTVRAVHWYQIAVSGGLVRAKVNLGVAYLFGVGVAQNEQMAIQFFSEAAAQGDGLGACFLGEIYDRGNGVPQDQVAAEQWYVKGAKLRNPQAEYDLGLLYFQSKDHAHDLKKAAKLLRKASAAGYVPAMHSLGLLLALNPDLAESPGEATAHLGDAASAGSWRSSAVIGMLARDGRGVPLDSPAAYYHFRVAVLQGGEDAKAYLKGDIRKLSSELGPTRTESLDSQAESWYQGHHNVLEFVCREGENRTRFPNYALASSEIRPNPMQMLPAQPN